MRILLVDDDKSVAETLKKILTDEHHAVDIANDGHMGWQFAIAFDYDLIVLDVVLPKLDGLEFCHRLRQHSYSMPVLLITALDSSTKKIAGLDAGADDYITKPFEIEEFLARVRVLLRRGQMPLISSLTYGDLCLEPTSRDVHYSQTSLRLTPKEYALLELLLRNPSQVFSRGAILDSLWNCEEAPGEDTVTAHMKGLRRKLTQAGAPNNLIKTVYGVGYRLNPTQPRGAQSHRPMAQPINSQVKATPSTLQPQIGKDFTISNRSREAHVQKNPDQKHCPPSSYFVESVGKRQQKTQAALAALWRSVQPQHVERLNHLKQMTQSLDTQLDAQEYSFPLRDLAFRAAHSMAGALGIFGLATGSDLARQIEQLLQGTKALSEQTYASLCQLVDQLEQEILHGFEVGSPTRTVPHRLDDRAAPIVVIVDNDWPLLQQLADAIALKGLTVATIWEDVTQSLASLLIDDASLPEEHQISFSPPLAKITKNQRGVLSLDVVLVNYGLADHPDGELQQIGHLIQQSRVPLLVGSHSGSLTHRVKASQLGSDSFLHAPDVSTLLQDIQSVRACLKNPTHTILAVDDDPQLLAGMRTLLVANGLQLVALNQPTDFWFTLQALSPDLLLLDIEMPKLNGLELCRVVRQSQVWNQIPIVFLTAYGDANTKVAALKAGANDLIEKSLATSELLSCVYAQLRRSQVRQALASTAQAQTRAL